MGLLLLQYEYQRAKNQVNLCERNQIQIENQLNRYTKRVGKMEEMFQKAESRLNSQYNQMTSQFNTQLGLAGTCKDWSSFIGAVGGIVVGGTSLVDVVPLTAPSGSDAATITTAIQQALSILRTNMAQMIESCKQIDEDRLEEQRNAQLDPIQEKEDEYQQKESANRTLTTLWDERCKNAEQRLGMHTEGFGKFSFRG